MCCVKVVLSAALPLLITAPFAVFFSHGATFAHPHALTPTAGKASLLKQQAHPRRHNFAPVQSLIITQQQIAGPRRRRRG